MKSVYRGGIKVYCADVKRGPVLKGHNDPRAATDGQRGGGLGRD